MLLTYILIDNLCRSMYSKVSIIRPGHSRLLEFEKKVVCTGHLIDTVGI